MNLKTIYTLFAFICIYSTSLAQNETPYKIEEDYYSIWNIEKGKSAVVFVDNAYIRDTPSASGDLMDSLSGGTTITISSPAYNMTKIKGFEAPWYKINYKKNNQERSGYIWLGLLALKVHDLEGNKRLLHGIERYIVDKDSGDYYLCKAKLYDNNQNKLSEITFKNDWADQRYTDSKVLDAMGLDNINHIFRIMYSGEACGIPTTFYYLGLQNDRLIAMPSRQTVSDAGIYYYEEKFLFPSEHNLEENVIYKEIETGEVIDENAAELKYKVDKKREKYRWDGVSFTKLSL